MMSVVGGLQNLFNSNVIAWTNIACIHGMYVYIIINIFIYSFIKLINTKIHGTGSGVNGTAAVMTVEICCDKRMFCHTSLSMISYY